MSARDGRAALSGVGLSRREREEAPMAQTVLPAERTHYFPSDEVHFAWDAGNAPVLTVASGDTVVMHTRDAADNQIRPESTADALALIDWAASIPSPDRSRSKARLPATHSGSRSSTSI